MAAVFTPSLTLQTVNNTFTHSLKLTIAIGSSQSLISLTLKQSGHAQQLSQPLGTPLAMNSLIQMVTQNQVLSSLQSRMFQLFSLKTLHLLVSLRFLASKRAIRFLLIFMPSVLAPTAITRTMLLDSLP